MMPTDYHANSEVLASQAEAALRAGDRKLALTLYAKAAVEESEALQLVSPEKMRTRGILAVSAASLFYKAREWNEAEQVIFRSLADRSLPNPHTRQLRDLLEVVWDERVLAEEQHARYAGDGLLVAMRGGLIGFGTATLDQFLHTFDGMRHLFYRVTEFVAGMPFRKSGLPREEIRDVLKARTTQPSPGSYRFRIRLIEPDQLELFEKPAVKPEAVTDTLFNFVESASSGDEKALADAVPDEQYRTTMLKLLRNISPDGNRMEELQLLREGGAGGESVSVWPHARTHIRSRLQEMVPVEPQAEMVTGTLRALDLDKKTIDVTPAGTTDRLRLHSLEVILDDVVGPMVNQRVAVTGVHKKGHKRTFRDIELDDSRT